MRTRVAIDAEGIGDLRLERAGVRIVRRNRGWASLGPIDALRKQQVPMAVATDLNPGTSPLRSLRLAASMACTLFRLTPDEALRAITVNGARALGLRDRGVLAPGMRADVVVWDARHPAELAYWIGGRLARRVFAAGNEVSLPESAR